jgi:hypothetical protein
VPEGDALRAARGNAHEDLMRKRFSKRFAECSIIRLCDLRKE